MAWKKGECGNPKGRPRIKDSLAQQVRKWWQVADRRAAITALAKKATGGDQLAYTALQKSGWPDEARGQLNFTLPVSDQPVKVTIELHRGD